MSAGDLITQPGQIQFRDLLLGMGTDYNVTKLVGWEDLPPVDNGYKHKPRQHGADPGLLLAQAHAITATLDIDPLTGGGTAAARSFLRSRTGLGTDATLEPIAVCLDTGDVKIRYGQLKARNIPISLGYELAVRDAVLQWECADPRLYGSTLQTVLARLPVAAPASQVTRTNYSPNSAAVGSSTGFASYSAGTGEVGTQSFITGAGDGPLPEITTYGRWSVTTPKTSGSTGWVASAFASRGQLSGNAGDPFAVSLYLRYTGTGSTTVNLRTSFYNSGGTSLGSVDSSAITLPSGQWIRATLTGAAPVAFASVGWWPYQVSGNTLPAGSTLDATGVLIEGSTTVIGPWFNGATPAVPNQKTYAWLGTVNNSASTETTSGSGLYTLTYPFSYPQLVAGGGPQPIINAGNAPTPPVYTIAGPVTSPAITITDSTGSRRIVFNLQLAAGEQLIIDVLNRTVTLGVGGASRYGFSSGVPIENLYLASGTSTIALDGSGDSTTSLTVTYRDADL